MLMLLDMNMNCSAAAAVVVVAVGGAICNEIFRRANKSLCGVL